MVSSASAKYLGIVLDDNLYFNDHIKKVIIKLIKHSLVVVRLRNIVEKNLLWRYCRLYIQPII